MIVLTDQNNSSLLRLASLLAMHSFLKKSKKLKIEYCKETFDFTWVVMSQYMFVHPYFDYWLKFKPNEKINPSVFYHCNLHGTKIWKTWKIKIIDFKNIRYFFFAHLFLSSKNGFSYLHNARSQKYDSQLLPISAICVYVFFVAS